MTEEASSVETAAKKKPTAKKQAANKRPAPRATKKNGPDLTTFRTWLGNLGMMAQPSIHVNGLQHANVVMVVDFGVPHKQPKLTPEQTADLHEKMKAIVVEMAQKPVSVRVNNDSANGIWWASIG